MASGYGRLWAKIFLFTAGTAFWVFEGQALVRKHLLTAAPPPPQARTQSQFVALGFPRITADGRRFTIHYKEFETILEALSKLGYTSIGLKDVQDFYEKNVLLPRKAVLLGFTRDDPQTVKRAEKTLRRLRMRGVIFLNMTNRAQEEEGDVRHSLPPHTISQLKKSGAWDFGWTADVQPKTAVSGVGAEWAFDPDGLQPWTKDSARRFIGSKAGFNNHYRSMKALRMMLLRTDRPAADNITLIDSHWTRTRPFADDFKKGALALDWIVDWGIVSAARSRLAILPTPKQTSASVYLNGTEGWRDCVVEFELKRRAESFWSYVRREEGRHFLRVGAVGDRLIVQQQAGPDRLPSLLGSAPLPGLPARVRIVAKGGWVMVHLNDRMLFGRALRVNPDVDLGRVEFGVFDEKAKKAYAILGWVKARPLDKRWIALAPGALSGDEDAALARLREQAILASAISPLWVKVREDGRSEAVGGQRDLIRSLAGFYRCMLVPMIQLPETIKGDVAPLVDRLAGVAAESDAAGLNVRLPPSADHSSLVPLLLKLRARLEQKKMRLWVTLDRPEGFSPTSFWSARADGVLKTSGPVFKGGEFLEVSRPPAAEISIGSRALWR